MLRFNLKPLINVLADTRPLTQDYINRANKLRARYAIVDEQIKLATRRARRLESNRPGYEGLTISEVFAETGESAEPNKDTYAAKARFTTRAGIEDLEGWGPLNGDAVKSVGTRHRQDISRLLAGDKDSSPASYQGITERFPAGHPARQLYAAIGQLDSQGTFVLVQGGFWQRLRDILGDDERGVLKTDTLESAFDFDAEQWVQWNDLIKEVKNAKKFNRRVMGDL